MVSMRTMERIFLRNGSRSKSTTSTVKKKVTLNLKMMPMKLTIRDTKLSSFLLPTRINIPLLLSVIPLVTHSRIPLVQLSTF
jgi:hypothetical protein